MSANGVVLPRMNSIGVIGVTMICSIVPISFSRTTAMLVNSSVHERDDDHDHAGHEKIAAFEVLVEPGPV